MSFKTIKNQLLVLTTLSLVACGGSDSGEVSLPSKQVSMQSDYEDFQSLGKNVNNAVTVNLGSTPKTLYVLLTNHNATQSSEPSIEHSLKVATPISSQKKSVAQDTSSLHRNINVPSHVMAFNENSHNSFQKNDGITPQSKIIEPRKNVVQGDTDRFYYGISNSSVASNLTDATAKRIVSDGTKTIILWVSNDTFDSGSGCSKETCVTQTMVDDLADKFLKAGTSNDTYDWVSNIYGAEWGDHNYSNLISNNDEISILLTDIDNDDSKSQGTIGYFYAKDNFFKTEYSGSNERVMFYIDSVMFANDDDNDYWKKAVYATLAHEFTHMIEFYQKDVLRDQTSDVWIAEMLAESTEYVTSNRVQHDSPRGVAFDIGNAGNPANSRDRYPDFNRYNNTYSLSSFDNNIEEYSKVSSFGTFLVNNYGGPTILKEIMYSSEADETSIIDAVDTYKGTSDTTFGELIRDWGVAVLLSDKDNLPLGLPRYNTGDFTTTSFNGTDYDIGSINFFNYLKGNNATDTNDSGPTISTSAGTVQPHGNFYYKVGDNLDGPVTVNIKTDSNTEATLISK